MEIFETKRLLIRPWQESDAEELFWLAKDERVGPRAGWPVHTSVENSREIIRTILSKDYAVILREENRLAGCIGLMIGERSRIAECGQEAEIGYWLGVPYWGRGYMPEAVEELLRYAFLEKGIKTVWCGYFEGNEQSKRVQEKCGFIFHHIRENVRALSEEEVRREYISRLTKEQWEKNREKR